MHKPGSVCGYPDAVSLGGDRIGVALHGYPDDHGLAIQWLELRDRT